MSNTESKGLKANPKAESSIDQDSLHGILSNARRRHIIQSLATYDQLEIGDTAEQLASIEQGKPVPDLTHQERKRVYIGLYQTHLPKLDSVDVIDWNSEEGVITRGPIYRVARDGMAAGSEAIQGPDSLVERVKNFFTGGASA